MGLYLLKGIGNSKIKYLFCIFLLLFIINLTFLFLMTPAIYADVEYPDYTGFVNDYTGLLDSEWKDKIEQICIQVESKTGAEIAVAIVPTLQGITQEEYSVKLFEKWKIGKADKDNGVLLLLSPEGEAGSRPLRIEVGYGLEGAITDLEAANIIDSIKSTLGQDFDQGVYNGVAMLANEIYEEYGYETVTETTLGKTTASGFTSFIEKAFSYFPCLCCIPVFVVGLIIWLISYIKKHKCPKCRKIKLKIKRTVIQKPTYKKEGKALEERTCSYCGYHDQKIVKLPKKRRTRSGGFFIFGGGGGGFSGGGSSFGGFGGGSSGGGGASGGW